jgi:transcriptional regulator with XRE-family HTH domain
MITGRQIAEARELLGWPRYELAMRVKIVTTNGIARMERFDSLPAAPPSSAGAIKAVLEAAGIEFSDLIGVRLLPIKLP